MASFKDLPVHKRLDTKLANMDYGVIHRIDAFFADKNFADGFSMSEHTEGKLRVISDELHFRFFDHERQDRSDITHEPFYFACAATSLIERRPRIALSRASKLPDEPSDVDLSRVDDLVGMYLRKKPHIDTLIQTYADRLGDEVPTHEGSRSMTFPRLLSGMTFFLLECENGDEYLRERAAVREIAALRQMT